MTSSQPAASRRTFLRGAIGAAAIAAGAPALAACSNNGNKKNTSERNSKVTLPTYTSYAGVTPTLPGTEKGVMPFFESYPAKPVRQYPKAPGKGDSISAFVGLDGVAVPPALGSNKFWQALNKQLNLNLKLRWAPAADYTEKFQINVAGGDLADVVSIRDVAQLPDLLASKFEDLTPFLGGDAAKKYPSLANIPGRSWKTCVYDGGIYGIPLNRSVFACEMIFRSDLAEKYGVKAADVTDGDSFLELCRAVTDRKQSRWAVGDPHSTLVWLNEMNGTPYLWKQEGGKFTSQYETDGYRKSLDTIAKMLKEGLFFPDAFGTNLIQDLIGSGKVFMNNGGAGTAYFQYPDLYKQAAPTFALGYLEPMKWDGGGRSPIYLGTAKYAGPVAIRKASKDRVAYILSVMDYLASPFGTAEYLFNNFGVEGTDFTFTKTNPIKTPAGVKETNLPLRYMAAGPLVTYYGKDPQAGRDYHGYQTSVLDSTVDAASLGLYSPTEQSKASLTTDLTAIQDDVMQGRKSLKDWDNAVAKWRKNGGDQIRKEYEQAFEKSH